MIVDRAGFLTAVIRDADAAGDANLRQAALAQVSSKLATSLRTLTPFVIVAAPWGDRLDAEVRDIIRERAAMLADALRPLQGMNDEELTVVGGNADEANRGALARIGQLTQNLRAALSAAQDDLVRGWAERVWPEEQLSRLAVLSVVPTSAAAAHAVREAREALYDNIAIDRALPEDELRRLEARATAGAQQAKALEAEALPDDVAAFWAAADGGAPLNSLSVAVLEWLIDHDAAELFRVERA
jgi:hypothetical protein